MPSKYIFIKVKIKTFKLEGLYLRPFFSCFKYFPNTIRKSQVLLFRTCPATKFGARTTSSVRNSRLKDFVLSSQVLLFRTCPARKKSDSVKNSSWVYFYLINIYPLARYIPEKSGQAGINEGVSVVGFILHSFNVVRSIYWFYMVFHSHLIDINISRL